MVQKTCIYYITFQCNDSCEFCGIWGDEQLQKVNEANLDLHFANLISAKRNGAGILQVTGGEPLLYEGLPQVLTRAKEMGFDVQLFTNGILYPERARELRGLTDRIFFSLDYPLPEDHDRSRGVECYYDVVKGIRMAKELGANPAIKFILTRDSVRFLPEMFDLTQNLKVKAYIHTVHDFQGLQGFDEFTYDHIKYYMKRKNMVINLAEFEFLKNHGNNNVFPRCRANETTITFLPDGARAAPCFYNRGGREGRESVCFGCARFPYMLPSFKIGFDKYRILDWYSDWLNSKKGAKI